MLPIPSSFLNLSAQCPCLTVAADLVSVAAVSLQARGYPLGYGQGCRAHDQGLAKEGCGGDGDQPYHCSAKWCYVDASTW